MNKRIILLLFWTNLPLIIFGQSGLHQIKNIQENDSLIKSNFNDYLDLNFSQSKDSIPETDSLKNYKINFITKCSYRYYDSPNELVCTKNLQKVTDTIHGKKIFLNFFEADSSLLTNIEDKRLIFGWHLEPSSLQFYSGHVFSSFRSFNNGKHLIITETRSASDKMSSPPHSISLIYFLERLN